MRWGGLVIAAWGVALLYAAWKPGSLPGRLFVSSYRAGSTMATIRQYWCGVLGAICAVLGAIFFLSA
jgi:hypothetical protein